MGWIDTILKNEDAVKGISSGIGALAGGLGLLGSEQKSVGYQGEVPKYGATRERIPYETNEAPGRRPGQAGRRYFTDTFYSSKDGERGLPSAAVAQQTANDQKQAILNNQQFDFPTYAYETGRSAPASGADAFGKAALISYLKENPEARSYFENLDAGSNDDNSENGENGENGVDSGYIKNLYNTMFDRDPSEQATSYWRDYLQQNNGDTDKLEAAILEEGQNNEESIQVDPTSYGLNSDYTGYGFTTGAEPNQIETLYQDMFGRVSSNDAESYWMSKLEELDGNEDQLKAAILEEGAKNGENILVNPADYGLNSDYTGYGGQSYAKGGVASLPTSNGYYLGGSTDGMKDEVPASLNGEQQAALSDGEFVVPADVVSHLGNGNSNAGAQQLFDMMDRIRTARTGNSEQGKKVNPQKMLPR